MRTTLLPLMLASLLTGCAISDTFRLVQLEPSLLLALCGSSENTESQTLPVALAGTNSQLAGGAVSCTLSHPPALQDRRTVTLEFVASATKLPRPEALILVAAERPLDGRLSAELIDAIKIQAAPIGMARVVMLDKTALSDQGIYLGYAYR